jgi:hypothetical protein
MQFVIQYSVSLFFFKE